MKREPVENACGNHMDVTQVGTMEAQMKTAPNGGGNTDRSLTRSSDTTREGLPHMVDQPRPPLTPIQQLLLIRSIAGHVTADTSPEHAQTALEVIKATLNGRDPVAGDR